MFETTERDDSLLEELKERNNRSFERLRRLIRDLKNVVEEPDREADNSNHTNRLAC